jgi:hypothetical protein
MSFYHPFDAVRSAILSDVRQKFLAADSRQAVIDAVRDAASAVCQRRSRTCWSGKARCFLRLSSPLVGEEEKSLG